MQANRRDDPSFKALEDREAINMSAATHDMMAMTLYFFKRIWGDVKNCCTRDVGLREEEYEELQRLLSTTTTLRSSSL